jgi:cell division protease FtsH
MSEETPKRPTRHKKSSGKSPKKQQKHPQKKPQKVNPFLIIALIWIALLASQYFYEGSQGASIAYSRFLELLERDRIQSVTISKNRIRGKFREPIPLKQLKEKDEVSAEARSSTESASEQTAKAFTTIRVEDSDLTQKLRDKNVSIQGELENNFWSTTFVWLLPFILLILFWRYMFAKMSGSGGAQGGLLSFGKSKAKVYVEKDTKVSFDDIAGVDEAKEELQEVVSFLKDPEKFSRLGGRTPKGILLVGPPGTGKTLMAKAVAGEANVTFFSINGSEFVEMFVGMGAARVRDLFEQARKNAPCILFVDELDALGKSRAMGSVTGSNDEKEQTLNQLLAEMDGFDSSSGILLLAATNRPEILDPALLRAGRFDRQVLIDNPDQAGRKAILEIHARKIKLSKETSLDHIASLTPGFSGADLENLVNEAALVATRRNAKAVEENDFTAAIERIVAGLERKKRIMNENEKKRVAYHEMGHATVALSFQKLDKVHKISIIPRGVGSLGYTLQRPTEDRFLMTEKELLQKIAGLMGGRVAEFLIFGEVSTGAGDDLNKATDIARAMVTQYSMSKELGLPTYEKPESMYLQGQQIQTKRSEYSEKTGETIDREVRRILQEGFDLTKRCLEKNRKFLETGAQRLLKEEKLDEKQIKKLWSEHGVTIDSSSET